MPVPLERAIQVDGSRVHRFQVVRERRDGDPEEWIVVGFNEGEVRLADREFEWTRTVPLDAFGDGAFEPLSAAGVPVWGY